MEAIESITKRDVRRMMTLIFCVCIISSVGISYAMHQLLTGKEGGLFVFGSFSYRACSFHGQFALQTPQS